MPPIVLLGGVLLLSAAAIGVVVLSLSANKGRGRQRLASIGAGAGATESASDAVPGIRSDAAPIFTSIFADTAWYHSLQLQLIRGGWLLRPSEFIAMCVGVGIVVAALTTLATQTVPLGVLAGAGVAMAPYSMLKSRQQKRRRMLSLQLPDALDMLSSSLRSGFALLRAMQVIRSQMHPPIAEEFGRVVDEVQYGIPVDEALDNLVLRTGNYDLELIVAAVQTQLAVGGNLAEIFGNIAEMIRERVRLLGELSAASAEGRLSAGILMAMPFAMALMVSVMNPGYLTPLFHQKLGLILVGVGVALMVVGGLVMRKLIDIDV